MRKLPSWAVIEAATQTALNAIPADDRPNKWKGKRKAVRAFKKGVQDHGAIIQEDRCVWCSLECGERGHRTAHPDHIAPSSLYGKWTFEARNIAIACEYCNGFAIKGGLDTVSIDAEDYQNAVFRIVHPYFDEVDQHVGFHGEDPESAILIAGLSEKGKWTISELKLDSPSLTLLRANDYLIARKRETIPPHLQALFDHATRRK